MGRQAAGRQKIIIDKGAFFRDATNYDEIEIDLRDVFRAIFSRWWLIFICILVSAATSYK